ncbi:hypothetical protein GBA52_009111, partial [Prunus armeniaca]
MKEREANEVTKCRLFPTTLKGPATSWFQRLTPESIGSFAELREVFMDRYMIIFDQLYTTNDFSVDLLHEAISYSRVEQLNLARKGIARPNPKALERYRPKEKRSNDYAYDLLAKRKKEE